MTHPPVAACLVAIIVAGCTTSPAPSSAVRVALAGPNAEEYGASDGYPIGDRRTFARLPFLVGSYSHMDEIFQGQLVRRADMPSSLTHSPVEPALRYEYQGRSLDLDQYLAGNPTTGLLIARDDAILVERYQYARTDRHRFTSQSMAKTVTSMLIGIAIAEGRIRSVDDPAAAYVPGLTGTEYGGTSLRHLLQMSSGVRFLEEYSGRDDVARLVNDTFGLGGPGGVRAVTQFNERAAPSGTRFSYASAETQVLGLVLSHAVGRSVADYLQEKIWRPIGAEADATWLVDRSGHEATFCCLNAVLRDWGRLGLLLAHNGNWRGRQIIPAAWIRDATSMRPDQPNLRPRTATRFFGYGYQVWIFPEERRMFAFLGLRGQAIYVDPANRLVMVHTAVRKLPVDPGVAETVALWRGVVRTLGRSNAAASRPAVGRGALSAT
jgi:CubicO group peptidase (beta-lactamase class C family)